MTQVNRGRTFENELSAVHDWYRINGKADIVQNPNEWKITTDKNFYERSQRVRDKKAPPGALATLDNGNKMLRITSDVDFSGGGRNFSILFDAKETSSNRFPLDSVHTHQIERLVKSARCGCIAGLMVKFVKLDRVFFIPARVVRKKEEGLLRQMGRQAKPGTASFSIEELEADAVEITKHRMNGLWDWFSWLVKES